MKSKFKKFLASFGILSTMIVAPSAIIASTVNKKEANAFFGKKTEMIWIQKGEKHVDGNDYKTSHDGRVWARDYFWSSDEVFWRGVAEARVERVLFDSTLPNRVVLGVETWVEGSGRPSVSSSIGISQSSGLETSLGISSNPTEKGRSFSYVFEDTNTSSVHYSYSGRIWSWSYVGISTNALFKEKNKVIIVDSMTDNSYEYKKYVS
ncbi:hypothetical protein [Mycoplasmoides gallisepticum]|nr:hypothetical protein [Mycoplasmoides gallisepticum]